MDEGIKSVVNKEKAHLPSKSTEESLLEICQNILGVEKIGLDDNFFELGGTSIMIVDMCNIIETLYPGRVKVVDIFYNTTISKLAQFIDGIADKIPGENSVDDDMAEVDDILQRMNK